MLSDLFTHEPELHPQAWLYHFSDHSAFAYARTHDFFRCRDNTRWAYLSDGWLISARSGDRLAYQLGSIFYDALTHEPLYFYESP